MRDAVKDMLASECSGEAVRAAWASEDGRVAGLWDQLAQMGVAGATGPEDAGGMGMTAVDWVLLLEELGYVACPEPIADHTAVGIAMLTELPSSVVRDAWLASAVAGETVLAVAFDGEYVAAPGSDRFLIQSGNAVHAVLAEDVVHVVQNDTDHTRHLVRLDWEPTPENCLAKTAPDIWVRARARAAVACAAELVGLGRRMIDMTVEYAKVREQFGKPIGAFQAVHHHLVDAHMALQFAAPMVYRAAWCLDTGADDREQAVSIAKATASDAALLAARKALQVHGAIGYSTEHDLHMYMKRVWSLARAHGDPAAHRRRLAELVLGAQDA